MVKGKPHSDFAGYVAERRNIYSGGHTVILDCRFAAAQGTPLVEDDRVRYRVLCNEHSELRDCATPASARLSKETPRTARGLRLSCSKHLPLCSLQATKCLA